MDKLIDSISTLSFNNLSNNNQVEIKDYHPQIISKINESDFINQSQILNNSMNNNSKYIHTNNISKQKSKNNITQAEITQISLQQKNIKLSNQDQKYFQSVKQQVVTNYYYFDFRKIRVDEIFLYSITVQDWKGVENAHYGLIKRLARSPIFKNFLLSKFFFDFWITGNTLFGEPINPEENLFEFGVYYFDNQDKIIDLSEVEKYPNEYVYVFRINKKFNIKDFEGKGVNASLNDRQHITRFMSSIINRCLEKNNYKKTDSSQRSLHYKMDPQDYVYTDSDIYFVSGIKIVTNFYDQQKMLCKAVQKFRMLRKQTYLDLWKYCLENYGRDCQKMFYNFCIGKEGFTIYSEKNIRIDTVEFNYSPATFYIDQANGVKIPLIQYYGEKYKFHITDPNQPLFGSKRYRKTKDKSITEEIIYFVPELLFIMGKMSFDNINVAKYTLLKPQVKFNRTNNIMRVIRDFQNRVFKEKSRVSNKNTNLSTVGSSGMKNTLTGCDVNIENKITERNINFELQKIQSYVLKNPRIEIHQNKLTPDSRNGEFDLKNQIVFKQIILINLI